MFDKNFCGGLFITSCMIAVLCGMGQLSPLIYFVSLCINVLCWVFFEI